MKFVGLVREFYPDELFWHTPSGKKRVGKDAIALKQMGLIAGVPDLFFPRLRWFVEMKAPGGEQSDDQIRVFGLLAAMGYDCAVFDNGRKAFAAYEAKVHGAGVDPRREFRRSRHPAQ